MTERSESVMSAGHTFMRASSAGKPLRYGVHSIQNLRREMEDSHRAVLGGAGHSDSSQSEQPLGEFSYFSVFDGHGGARAAEFASDRLCDLLATDRAVLLSDPAEALRRAFVQTEAEWLDIAQKGELMDGTTAAVALVDKRRHRCIVGNVGDSEVLLGTLLKSGEREHRVLTEVHQLKRNPSEVDRVTSDGGRIWRNRLGHPKISPQVMSLSVSRAIGDISFKDDRYTGGQASGLSAEPFITSVEVCTDGVQQQFLLIGCDGLWDTVTYSEAAELTFRQLQEGHEPQAVSEALVRRARDTGSSDNITVMVVLF